MSVVGAIQYAGAIYTNMSQSSLGPPSPGMTHEMAEQMKCDLKTDSGWRTLWARCDWRNEQQLNSCINADLNTFKDDWEEDLRKIVTDHLRLSSHRAGIYVRAIEHARASFRSLRRTRSFETKKAFWRLIAPPGIERCRRTGSTVVGPRASRLNGGRELEKGGLESANPEPVALGMCLIP